MDGEYNMALKNRFVNDVEKVNEPKHLIVAVKLPTGATEIIHNTEFLQEKIEYYKEKYDDDFRLKTAPAIQIIDYMLI